MKVVFKFDCFKTYRKLNIVVLFIYNFFILFSFLNHFIKLILRNSFVLIQVECFILINDTEIRDTSLKIMNRLFKKVNQTFWRELN